MFGDQDQAKRCFEKASGSRLFCEGYVFERVDSRTCAITVEVKLSNVAGFSKECGKILDFLVVISVGELMRREDVVAGQAEEVGDKISHGRKGDGSDSWPAALGVAIRVPDEQSIKG